MRLQVLVPLHVDPDAGVHAKARDATVPQATSVLGDVVLDLGALVGGVLAQCRARGEALRRAMEDELCRRGVALRTTETDGMMGHIGDAGLARAHRYGLTLIVIDAFGHSRVRDFVLGSATGGVLRDLRLPVMLSH